MRKTSWPVTQDETRRLQDSDQCCWCKSHLGEQHEAECVCRKQTVVVRMTIEYVVDAPESWDADAIEFHRNESSWCAGNAAGELEGLFARLKKRDGCPCNRVKYAYVREATIDDEEACGVSVAGEESST